MLWGIKLVNQKGSTQENSLCITNVALFFKPSDVVLSCYLKRIIALCEFGFE